MGSSDLSGEVLARLGHSYAVAGEPTAQLRDYIIAIVILAAGERLADAQLDC